MAKGRCPICGPIEITHGACPNCGVGIQETKPHRKSVLEEHIQKDEEHIPLDYCDDEYAT